MINANEQRVIRVAEGTFEYQGELYTVRSTYLRALKRKLNEKKVELTPEQADKALRKIYSNVEKGVREGYLKKLSREQADKKREEREPIFDGGDLFGDGSGTGADAQQGTQQEAQQGKRQGTQQETQQGMTVPAAEGVQQAPLHMEALEKIRNTEVEGATAYTANEQVARQLNAGTGQTAVTMLAALSICIPVLVFYLKVFKHRRKAFPVMSGAVLMGLSILVAGGVYMCSSRAWSADTWETVAVESGYFKERQAVAQSDLRRVLSGIGLEPGVEISGLEDSAVYRDAKSIFSARLAGQNLPELSRWTKEIREALYSVLPKEPVENVNEVSDVLVRRYRMALDTPYAAYLSEMRQRGELRNTLIITGCFFMLVLSTVFIWRGTKYMHRRFRGLSYGIGMAGAAFLAAGAVNIMTAGPLSVEPEAYRLLFEGYVKWCNENILYFGILLLCISVFTWGAAYVTRKSFSEKTELKIEETHV